jgi:iron complex outermembrane receptor protein
MPAIPLRGGAVLAVSMSLATAAYAQSASEQINLPTVTVTAQSGAVLTAAPFDDPVTPTGQTITTIGQDRIDNTPAFSIGDVLRESPGISTKQGNGPRDIGISIRGSNARNGFGVRNIVIFEDGFPVTQPDGLSRTDITDPHAYGRIDVYRGPSSAMFGNYATGGAINFHLRPGADIGGLEFGSDAGSFNYFNEYALFGDRQGPFEYSGIVSYVRGEGFQPNQSFTTTTGNILASYSPTPDDKIVVKVIDNYVGTSLPIRLSLNQYNLNPFQRGCITAASRSGCASVNLFVNGLSAPTIAQTASQAGLGRHDQRTILGTRWEHNFDADTLWRVQFVYDNKDINQPTGATSAVGDQPAFNGITDLTQHWYGPNGLEGTHFVQGSFNYVHLASDTFNLAPGGNARLGKETATTVGHQYNAAVRGREELNFSPQFRLSAGLGVEFTELDAVNTLYTYNAAGIPATSLIPALRSYLNAAPDITALYRPDEDWQLRGRIATGYGTPQASNLFVTAAGVPGNNTKLLPQKNLGFDIGADYSPDPTLKASLTGFYEIFHNELVIQSPGAGLQSFTFNAPRSDHRGIEAALDWRPLPGWRFTLAYLRNDQFYRQYNEQLSAGSKTATFDRSGNRIPGIEPDNVLARLSYDQPDGPLAGVGGFVEGYWRDSFFIDNANLVRAPGYAVVNLNLHYDPNITFSYAKKVMFFFEVQNLFNKTYVASANNVSDSLNATSGLQNGASSVAAATGSIYAGAPRTLIGGVKITF